MGRGTRLFPLVFASLFVVNLAAESVQERGLPGAVKFEAVFPHIVSGVLADLRYESQLVLVNSEDRDAQVELEFFFDSGESAQNFLDLVLDRGEARPSGTSWRSDQGLGRSQEDGLFYFKLGAHSVRRFSFPGEYNPLVGREFSAWAKLRSNLTLSALQEIRVTDERGVTSRADLTAAICAAKQAELSVGNFKSMVYSADPLFEGGTQIGWAIRTDGISLVNPGELPAEIELDLGGQKKTVNLTPRSKQALSVEDVWPDFGPAGPVRSGTITARSINGVPFALLGVAVRMRVDLDLAPLQPATEPWLYFAPGNRMRLPDQERLDWPENILATGQLGSRSITLTRFGFVLQDGAGEPAVHPANGGLARSGHVGITVAEQLGLAVIYGLDEIPVIFSATGRVLYVEAWGGGPAADCRGRG